MAGRTLKLLALGVVGATAAVDRTLQSTPNALEATNARGIFTEWMEEMEKVYETAEELEQRFLTFTENMKFVMEHNAEGHSYQVGLNGFADLTQDEFRGKYLGYKRSDRLRGTQGSFKYENTEPLDAIDWREKNAVTDVKNQQQCGSCWSFSATGSMEGIHAISSGKLVSLSEQELVDCDKTDNGCGGGSMDQAFQWVISNGGIDTEADYAYTAEDGTCNTEKEKKHVVSISGFEDVPPSNEAAMKKALSGQPVSIAIEADQQAFQLYHNGVFDATCGTQLDHGVLAVGYNADAFIVKNSWGATWGDSGYIQMKSGVSSDGICGMLLDPSYPTVDKVEEETDTKVAKFIKNISFRKFGKFLRLGNAN